MSAKQHVKPESFAALVAAINSGREHDLESSIETVSREVFKAKRKQPRGKK